LNGARSDFVASADVLDGNLCVRDAAKLAKVSYSGSVAIIEPYFMRSSAVECSRREAISDFDGGVNGFGPERCRET